MAQNHRLCVNGVIHRGTLRRGQQRPKITVRDFHDARDTPNLGASVPMGSDALTLMEMMNSQARSG